MPVELIATVDMPRLGNRPAYSVLSLERLHHLVHHAILAGRVAAVHEGPAGGNPQRPLSTGNPVFPAPALCDKAGYDGVACPAGLFLCATLVIFYTVVLQSPCILLIPVTANVIDEVEPNPPDKG